MHSFPPEKATEAEDSVDVPPMRERDRELTRDATKLSEEEFEKIWNNERYIKLRRIIKKGLLPACARCCKL